MIKFLPSQKKPIATKVGACFFSDNISSLPSLTSLSIPLGLQCFYYVDLNGKMDDAQAAIINTYLTATGAKIGVYIPIRLSNYLAYLDWAVKVFGSKIEFFQLDQEYTHLSHEEYALRCHQCMNKYPQYTFSWDTGLIAKGDNMSIDMNKFLSTQTGTIFGRQYEHLSDGCGAFTADQTANLSAIKNYYTTFLPNIQVAYKAALPNLSKQIIEQWNEYDGAELLSVPVMNYAIGEMVRFKLTNTQNYSHFFRQSITNMINQRGITPSYTSIKRFIPAFKFKNTMSVELDFEGMAQGVSDGKNGYGLVVNNSTSTEHTINASDIQIPNKRITGSFITDSGYSDSIYEDIQNSIITDSKFTIKKNSTNFITFNVT